MINNELTSKQKYFYNEMLTYVLQSQITSLNSYYKKNNYLKCKLYGVILNFKLLSENFVILSI